MPTKPNTESVRSTTVLHATRVTPERLPCIAIGRVARRVAPYVVLVLIGLSQIGLAQAPPTPPTEIAGGLDGPWGVAVQPETEHLFVSESGQGRIVRWINNQWQEVVIGFPVEKDPQRLNLPLGPLGIAFLNNDVLLVGCGGAASSEEVVYVFEVPKAGASPIQARDGIRLGPLRPTRSHPAAGGFLGVATGSDSIFATSVSQDGQGWLIQVDVKKSDLLDDPSGFGRMRHFIDTSATVQRSQPAALTLSPRGEVLVGFLGELNETQDAGLTFFRATDGALLLDLPLELYDLVALHYGEGLKPSLYALDLAWSRPSEGGLFRLDSVLQNGLIGISAQRLATLTRPTAMTRGLDGALYITTLGPSERENQDQPQGRVWRVHVGS